MTEQNSGRGVARTPVCRRCGNPVAGPRAIGAAAVPELKGWACHFCVTIDEYTAYLARQLEHGGGFE